MGQGIDLEGLFHEVVAVIEDFLSADDACVVDEDVYRSEGFFGDFSRVLDLFEVGAIAFYCYALATLQHNFLCYEPVSTWGIKHFTCSFQRSFINIAHSYPAPLLR